jgi:hypothetical protein
MGPATRGARAARAARAAAVVLLAAACGPSIHVDTDFSRQANFGGFRTYAFAEVPASAAAQNALDPLLTEKVRAALDHYLPGKGLQKAADSSQADLIVYTWGSSKQMIQIDSWGYTYGGYRYGGVYAPNTTVQNYSEGTLVVDFIDPRTKQLVWRGTASGTADDRKEATRLLEQAVSEMLRQYPPKG